MWPHRLYSPPGSSIHGILQARYWGGLPCLSPGDLPDTEIDPTCLMSPALAGRFFTTSETWEAHNCVSQFLIWNMNLLLVLFLQRAPTNTGTINIHWWGAGLECDGLGFYLWGKVLSQWICMLASQLPGVTFMTTLRCRLEQETAWRYFSGQIFLDMACFSKSEMKVREQSFSFFPSSVCVIGLRRTIWCESLNTIYLCLAKRSLLGCPDASIVLGRQWLNSRGLSLLVSWLQGEGLSSGCVASAVLQGLWRKYRHKFHHSFNPWLPPRVGSSRRFQIL